MGSVFCPDFGFREEVGLGLVRRINSRLNSISQHKFMACRCVLTEWEREQDMLSFSEKELRNLRKLLPISTKKITVAVSCKAKEGYIIQVTGVNRKTVCIHSDDKDVELARLKQENAALQIKSVGK